MSDLSLLNGIYANVDFFASLIDTVIEHMRTDGTAKPGSEQMRLGQLLVDARDHGQSSHSYEALMLDSLLRSPTGEPLVNFERLGRRLLSGQVDASDQKQLEKLATELENERSEVANRLRGRA
ncbi:MULTISPECIES: hypothetical protein [unclassified Bradyrhizobium]|uniref:hypothetical protein n=1 Tax=Bradyrhizobium sp. USDA 4541 TaxID=2817704 RepID=UPI0020A48F81|nr:hypothetical protein [Bradyrhizobium sp. USDA 4541]MCP1854420.1 hypothetical protein [Bradyrhizobium sp. USDA 4541]